MLSLLTATGIGTSIFHRAVVALAQDGQVDAERVREAAWITDLEIDEEKAEQIVATIQRDHVGLKRLRNFELGPEVAPAFQFRPKHDSSPVIDVDRNVRFSVEQRLPPSEPEIAFCSVPELSHFLSSGQITSVKLTALYLKRLKKYGPMLKCVVNLTEDLAMQQAQRADEEIAAGKIRGPLHGIPWGAKDLVDVPGYPTTWGIPFHKERMAQNEATVYKRLTDAGAVLIGKLSLGALAMGDKWFGGQTRNPWNPTSGSSGSSAGSCSATVAGLVGFSIGSETLGSITTPSKVCGANGFRPSFGRVSRYGCMPLSWTMDKIGPICRSVSGCAAVFAAIHGADGKDPTAENYKFDWPKKLVANETIIGFQPGRKIEESEEFKTLNKLGFQLKPAKLPRSLPVHLLASLINVEAASVFDELLRQGHTDGWNTWENTFRSSQFISAIDYIRMMRLRTKVVEEFDAFMEDFDLLFNVFDVFHSNLTGHPSVVVPIRFTDLEGGGKTPVSVTFTGHLNDDDKLLSIANLFQNKLGGHKQHPELDPWLEKFEAGTLDEQPKDQPDDETDKNADDGS